MVIEEDVLEKLTSGFSLFGAVTYKWERRYTVLTVRCGAACLRQPLPRAHCVPSATPPPPRPAPRPRAADQPAVLPVGRAARRGRQAQGGPLPRRRVRNHLFCARLFSLFVERCGAIMRRASLRAALHAWPPHACALLPSSFCSARLEVVNEGELPVRSRDFWA